VNKVKLVKGKNGGKVNQFERGESGNPNGRPRKMVSALLKELELRGVKNVTAEQIRGTIETLMNLTKVELDDVAKDEQAAVVVRLIARHLIKAGDKEQILEWLLSRAHGKPKETVETINDLTLTEATVNELIDKFWKRKK
jgi:hypothetical protein